MAGQDIEPGETEGTFRVARKVAADRVISTVDPDARHMHKSRSSYRDGYKAHLAVEPETGLVCAAALTPANAADGPAGVGLLAGERPGLQVLGDAAYGGGETRAALTAAGHAQLIKPIPLRPAVPGGFTKDDFAIDLHAGTVTCPAGHTVAITPGGRAVFDWRCGPCPLRERCTRAKDGKTLNLHPQEAELAAARRRATDPTFQASHRRWRPMVERSIAWLVANGHRRVRYRGLARNQLGLSVRVAAINLRGHGAGPYRCRVGAGLRRCQRARGVNEGRLYGLSHPAWPACTLKHWRFGSDISRARPQPTPPVTSSKAACSAGS